MGEQQLLRIQNALLKFRDTSPHEYSIAIRQYLVVPEDPELQAIQVLYYWHKNWPQRQNIRFFLYPFVRKRLEASVLLKPAIEAAPDSIICTMALEAIQDFEAILDFRRQYIAHKKEQRRLLKNSREMYYTVLSIRNGERCAKCRSKKRKLVLDHILPISRGGLTEILNLQLLCEKCNGKKRDNVNLVDN